MSEASVKPFLATKMKCAVVSALISLAFVSQASAGLRPLFSAKPMPPFNGEVIIVGGGASFGLSANVSRRMRANHGTNPKGNKEGRRMNDAQTLVLIHTVAWPILIWLLSKTWNYA